MPRSPLWKYWQFQSQTALMRLGQQALDFVFPPACLLCRRTPEHRTQQICEVCSLRLMGTSQHQCERCAGPVGPHLLTADGCAECRSENYPFRRTWAIAVYEGPLRWAIREGKQPHGSAMISGLTDVLLSRHGTDLWSESFDGIVPIPHHIGRRAQNLHAASETMAIALSRRLRRPYTPHILKKPYATQRQTVLTPSARRQQQTKAFQVPESISIRGARLLLVDDVMTTGATVRSATNTLLAAGAADVIVAVLARGIGRKGEVLS